MAAVPCTWDEHWELLAEVYRAGLKGIGGFFVVGVLDPVFHRGGRVGLQEESTLDFWMQRTDCKWVIPSLCWRASSQLSPEQLWLTPFYHCSGAQLGCLEVGCSKNSQWAADLGRGCPLGQMSPAEGWASLWGWVSQGLQQLSPGLSGHTPLAELPGGWLHQGSPPASLG